jgi:hypothetical protein
MGADDYTVPVATAILIVNHSSNGMVLKFSPTSPTRTHAHQLVNTRQSKRSMIVSTNTCMHVCRECSVGNLFYAK